MKSFILLVVLLLAFFVSSCEREGVVKYLECPKILTIKKDDLQTYYKTFVCQYKKRASGKVISGECVNLQMIGASGCSVGQCETAYIYTYQAEPDSGCTKEIPYKGYDNKCYDDWQVADKSKG